MKRPKLPRISEEMRRMCVMLGDEMLRWPEVRTNPMFGMRAFYRGKIVFAMLPDKRAFEDADSIMYKIANAAEKREGKKWTLLKLGFTWINIGFGAGFIIPLVGAWFYYRFGVADNYSGPILAVSNILIGFSALAAPRLAERFGQLRAVLLVTGASTLFMLSMAFVPYFALAAGVYIVRSALMNMAGPLMDSFSMSIFPPEQRGLVSALSNIMFRLPNSFGTYFGGFILGMGFLQLPFYIATLLYSVGLTGFYFFFARRPLAALNAVK